jgi:hypothetical protein
MTELIGIVGAAALFAVFGLLRGRIREETHGCGACPSKDDPSACNVCQEEMGRAVGR